MRISWPSHIAVRIVHDLTGWPSISTTQAPQLEVSQPQWVPVRPSVSRRKCTSSWRGSTSRGDLLAVDRHRDVHVRPPVQRARRRAAQRALGEHAGEMALVVDRAAAVGARRAVLRRRSRPPAANSSSDGGLPRSSSSARVRWIVVIPTALSAMPASAIAPPSIHTAAEAAAMAQSPARRSTFSCALPAPGRSGRRTSVSSSPRAHRGHVGPDVEVLHPDHPLAAGAADDHLRLGGRADGREVLGGVGLAQRAADRAAVAHHRVGDHGLGVAEEREVPREQLGLQQVDVAGQRADPDLAVRLADVGELGEVVDVDQVLGAGQPQLHHRQQAVAAGDDPRLGAEPLERRDRAVHAGGSLVLEWRGGLQRCSSSDQERLAGSRLRGAPMSSRCSYWTGASAPITGERGQLLRARVAHVGVELPRRQAAALDVAQHLARRARRRRSAPRGRGARA